MAMLPSVDLGLMAEHLEAHEGVINKVEIVDMFEAVPPALLLERIPNLFC
ncbi:hypothetical protein [Virgibacillus sediminis]|uniref:Carrier domain-containing protein n=1 Tax=Virgibacillus sediminis TaxID=202260 RepID=A0ABV7A1W0_9BACI